MSERNNFKKARKIRYITLLHVLLGAVILINAGCSSDGNEGEEPNLAKTYDGDSSGLKQTVIVPTLDTLMPKGKNVIWCSSFQIAWNELKDNIIGEPVRVVGAEEIANCLNQAKQSHADISEESYYAVGGCVRDGITEEIQAEMAKRFPIEPIPEFPEMSAEAIIIYCYLEASVKFKIPFLENKKDLSFKDSRGNKILITSFGARPQDQGGCRKLRKQVEVLYFLRDQHHPCVIVESAIDLCKYTKPYQMVLARIEPKETLGETLSDLEEKIERSTKEDEYYHEFGINDVLLVPNMFWKIIHHFAELEPEKVDDVIIRKHLGNEGYTTYWIKFAIQTIQFKLDRSGAELKSEAKLGIEALPRNFVFTGPFLLYIKKRGGEHPFFVMWVDNAELLSKP